MTTYYRVHRDRGPWLERGLASRAFATKSYAEAVRHLERVRDYAKHHEPRAILAIYRQHGAASANPWRRMDEPSDTRCPT